MLTKMLRKSLATTTTVSAAKLLGRRSYAVSTKTRPEEYDYIIVGAGSAGCVLAHRLSEAGNQVCVLEVGPPDDSELIKMPLSYTDLFYHKTFNWNYYTVPQREMQNRKIYIPRGKTLGGSSSINAMVFMRPHPLDLDRWAAHDGALGWSYAEALPYFKRLESYQPSYEYPKADLVKYRGFTGPLPVMSGKLRQSLYAQVPTNDAFIEAGRQAGLPYTVDHNGYQQEGVGWFDSTIDNGERMSTAASYLKLALRANPSRVHVRTNTLCTKLLFADTGASQSPRVNKSTKVVGVQTADANSNAASPTSVASLYARKEVIVASGTINSPQLLQLSGIGNADDLRQVGVEPVVHLPGVGQNLQDHLKVLMSYDCTPQPTHIARNVGKASEVLDEWRNRRTGIAGTNQMEAGGHFCTNDTFTHPNVEIHFWAQSFEEVNGERLKLRDKPEIEMCLNTQREHSRGELKLRNNNPFDTPSIDPRFLDDPRDVKELVDALKFARVIFRQKAFDLYRKGEVTPGDAVQTDKDFENYVRSTALTVYHPIGTCKMGDIRKDRLSVVDPLTMRVYGVDNLRVVDASVMPSEISCNLNACVVMMAERASDMILGRKLLPAESQPIYSRKN